MELDFVHIIADHGPGAMWQDVAQEDHGQWSRLAMMLCTLVQSLVPLLTMVWLVHAIIWYRFWYE